MMIRHIAGAQHVIGKEQGFLGLPIRVVRKSTNIGGTMIPDVMHVETAWEPTPLELKRINDGHSIIISLINAIPHPPIDVYVETVKANDSLDTFDEKVELAIEAVESLQSLVMTWCDEQQVKYENGNPDYDQIQASGENLQKISSALAFLKSLPRA